MFEQLDKQLTVCSNTASIERHMREAGASACTDASMLSMQERKADAVLLFEKVKQVCTEYEIALLIVNCSNGFSLYSHAIDYLKQDTEHYKFNRDLIDIYADALHKSTIQQIATKNDVTYKTVLVARAKLFKQFENDLLLAEKLIEREL